MTGDVWPVAFVALVRRNRRRYGGYIAHLGFAVMLIGVAASSSFQHSRNATLRPGQTVSNDGYVFHYVRPTAVATSERVSFGAVIDVTKHGKQVTTLHTDAELLPVDEHARRVHRPLLRQRQRRQHDRPGRRPAARHLDGRGREPAAAGGR